MSPSAPPDGADSETVRTPKPLPVDGIETVTAPVAADRVIWFAVPAMEVTDTAGVEEVQAVPLEVRMLPEVPTAVSPVPPEAAPRAVVKVTAPVTATVEASVAAPVTPSVPPTARFPTT